MKTGGPSKPPVPFITLGPSHLVPKSSKRPSPSGSHSSTLQSCRCCWTIYVMRRGFMRQVASTKRHSCSVWPRLVSLVVGVCVCVCVFSERFSCVGHCPETLLNKFCLTQQCHLQLQFQFQLHWLQGRLLLLAIAHSAGRACTGCLRVPNSAGWANGAKKPPSMPLLSMLCGGAHKIAACMPA